MKLALMVGAPDMQGEGGYVAVPTGGYDATLRRAARLGFDGVEILAAQRSDGDLRDLRQAVRDTGLKVAGLNSGRLFSDFGLALLCGDARHCALTRTAIYDLIRLAAAFETHINIGLFRGWPDSAGSDPALSRLVTILRELANYAQRLGVELLVEPQNRREFPFVVGTLAGLALVQQVGHPAVNLMLDTFHMHAEGEDLPAAFDHALPCLRHIHLLDAQRNFPRSAFDPGFDLARVIAALARLGYQHYLSVPLVRGADEAATAAAVHELRALIHSSPR